MSLGLQIQLSNCGVLRSGYFRPCLRSAPIALSDFFPELLRQVWPPQNVGTRRRWCAHSSAKRIVLGRALLFNTLGRMHRFAIEHGPYAQIEDYARAR